MNEQAIRPPSERALRRAIRHGNMVIGGTLLLLVLFAALIGPLIWPVDPFAQNLDARLARPFWLDGARPAHPLGTDHLGRDYLARLLHGARISLLIGAAATLVAGFIGTTLGVTAGYFGGWVDRVVLYVITVRLAMPALLIALAVIAIVGNSLMIVILVLGFALWDQFAVVMRTAVMQARTQDYVAAAVTTGSTTPRVILREIMPNVMPALIVVATVEMASAILAEAALSFLGLGVMPPTPSWGIMVAEGKNFMFFEEWLILLPGAAIMVLVLAISLIGDGLRDVNSVHLE
jgi:peptide/nickel transport system permease protein